VSSPGTSVRPPPVPAPPASPGTAQAPQATGPAPGGDAPAPAGTCGTVTTASGLTLQVLDDEAGTAPCDEAVRVVERFHERIAGRQAPGSSEPVSDTVDGWLCVSGPPSAQGGTTCGMGEQNILAAVIPVE